MHVVSQLKILVFEGVHCICNPMDACLALEFVQITPIVLRHAQLNSSYLTLCHADA